MCFISYTAFLRGHAAPLLRSHNHTRGVEIVDTPSAMAECPLASCDDIPLCYNPKLNTGPQLPEGLGREQSNLWLGTLQNSQDPPDHIDFELLEKENYGYVQHQEGSTLKSRAFMGKMPSCQAANAWNREGPASPYRSFIDSLANTLHNKQLTCDVTKWEEDISITVGGKQVKACRNKGNRIAHDAHGQQYDDASMYVWDQKEGEAGWERGWSQGYCPRNAAEAQRCNRHLPGRVPDGDAPGLKPDGTLDIDFSKGLAGELGVPQIGSKGVMANKRWDAWRWNNEIAIVKDPEHPEEGNVARLNSYVKNAGTKDSPVWVGGPLGGLVTTRMYASAKYEVRAKVPKATGYVWALWTFWGGVDVLSDVKSVDDCGRFADLYAGDKYSCATCRDTYPTSASPFFVNQETEPGIFLPQMGKQILNHEIDIEIPANAPQSTKDGIGGDISSAWKVPDKYNTLNMNNYRWTNGAGTGTYSNMFTVHDKPLQGDGKYHNYRFDWHTGGKDKTGKYQRARVDFYFDDEFIGSNDLMVPSGASRYWILLWPHGSGGPGGSGSWNGRISWWRDPATGQLHPNRDALGQPLPATPSNGLALYASTWVSRVLIEPFYEENDRVFPTAFDQPHMNRRVVCDSTNHLLACGTDQVIPLRTPNHYPLNENGLQVAPCCGATCMSQAALGSSSGTTDPAGQCPSNANSVPGATEDVPLREGGCECRKGGKDPHGDRAWAPNEYDVTCQWIPDKQYSVPAACNPEPKTMSYDVSKWENEDPWDMNFGCRLSITSACVPHGLSGAEADQACKDWVSQHCGEPSGEGYWEIWARENGACQISLRPPWGQTERQYTVFQGITENEAPSYALPEGEMYQGCSINFLMHPPAHDGTGEEIGCEWFTKTYCNGATIDLFEVRVSEKVDNRGHRVCSMYRLPTFIPKVPTKDEFPGFRAACDWDWSYYKPPCKATADCDDWKLEHCDIPEGLSTECKGGACQFQLTSSLLSEYTAPQPPCYSENPNPLLQRDSCDWDFIKYPPCGASTIEGTKQRCRDWVSSHCHDRLESFYVGSTNQAGRNNLYSCAIVSQWQQSVGGGIKACRAMSCLEAAGLSGQEGGEEPVSGPSPAAEAEPSPGGNQHLPPEPSSASIQGPSPSHSRLLSPTPKPSPSNSNSPSASRAVLPSMPPSRSPSTTPTRGAGAKPLRSPSLSPSKTPSGKKPGADNHGNMGDNDGSYENERSGNQGDPSGATENDDDDWWKYLALGALGFCALLILIVVILLFVLARRNRRDSPRSREVHTYNPAYHGTPTQDPVPNPLAGRKLELDTAV